MKSRFFSAIFVPFCVSILLSPLAFGAFQIVFTPTTSGFEDGTDAAKALTRAANLWGQYITDNITVEISVGFGSVPSGKLGVSDVWLSSTTYELIAGKMIADAKAITGGVDFKAESLPVTSADFVAQFPVGSGYATNGDMSITTANMDALFGDATGEDSVCTFSNTAVFDYDNSDGIGSYLDGNNDSQFKYDFESVVAHEIGHVLGFFSSLDFLPAPKPEQPMPLDLFRYSKVAPTQRSLTVDGTPAVTDTGGIFKYEMSTGTGVFGDGYQAGHWKDGLSIGLMTPALLAGTIYVPTVADLEVLDVIGYDVNYSPVPETTTLCSGLLLLLGVFRRRRVA